MFEIRLASVARAAMGSPLTLHLAHRQSPAAGQRWLTRLLTARHHGCRSHSCHPSACRHAELVCQGAAVLIAALLVLSASAQAGPSVAAAGPAWCWGEQALHAAGPPVLAGWLGLAQPKVAPYAAGTNMWGALGNGQTNSSDVPVPVADDREYTAIAAAYHVCAVDSAGTTWCWGKQRCQFVPHLTRLGICSVRGYTFLASCCV